jgi:tetratricopeptide (TPR) repeat protein
MAGVFISYRRRDRPKAEKLAAFFQSCGIAAWYDKNIPHNERDFPKRVREELVAAECVVVIWTRNSVLSTWVASEALYAANKRTRVAHLKWDDCDIPPPFSSANHVNVLKFDDQTKRGILDAVGARLVDGKRRGTYTLTNATIEIGTIPRTKADKLFGRQPQIEALTRYAEGKDTRIAVIHAVGGEGKTSLLNYWIREMQQRGWGDARCVFGWSFYTYGAEDRGQASADRFFDEALDFFGYDGDPLQLPEAKARELVRLIRRDRTVLILDGLEPLQHLTGSRGAAGRLRDPGMRRLLTELLVSPNCFALVTTRVDLGDLSGDSQPEVQRLRLPPLPTPDAVDFLRHLGVRGKDSEIETAVKDCRGHALTLSLLGRYLATVHGGAVSKRNLVTGLDQLDEATATGERSVGAIMQHYEQEYAVRQSEVDRRAKVSTATRQLALLRLFGLFDMAVPYGALKAVINDRPASALTETLAQATDGELRFALEALDDLGLLGFAKDVCDAHPLVRQYFRESLSRPEFVVARTQAHQALAKHYREIAERKTPATTADLDPWLQAIAHSCAAGNVELANALYEKVNRREALWIMKALGAHNTHIEILSSILTHAKRHRGKLSSKTKGILLGRLATSYQALGRTREAEKAYAQSFAIAKREDDWPGIAFMAQFQSDLAAERGQIRRAIKFGKVAVERWKRPTGPKALRARATFLASYGTALDRAGRGQHANAQFKTLCSEAGRAKRFREIVSGRVGYKVFRHFMSSNDLAQAENVAKSFTKTERHDASLVAQGLERLCLAELAAAKGDPAAALKDADVAVDQFWRGSEYSAIIRGLLMRAHILTMLTRYEDAARDLNEASALTNQAELDALKADVCFGAAVLSSARLRDGLHSATESLKREAAQYLDECRRLCEHLGYRQLLNVLPKSEVSGAPIG